MIFREYVKNRERGSFFWSYAFYVVDIPAVAEEGFIKMLSSPAIQLELLVLFRN